MIFIRESGRNLESVAKSIFTAKAQMIQRQHIKRCDLGVSAVSFCSRVECVIGFSSSPLPQPIRFYDIIISEKKVFFTFSRIL